jgi:hypothetical protein
MSTFSERKKGRAVRQATSMSYVSQPQSGRAGNVGLGSYTTSQPQTDNQHGVGGLRQDEGFGAKSENGVDLSTHERGPPSQASLPFNTGSSSQPATSQQDPSQAIEFAKTENEVFDLGSEGYEIKHNGQKGRSLWSKSVYKPGEWERFCASAISSSSSLSSPATQLRPISHPYTVTPSGWCPNRHTMTLIV